MIEFLNWWAETWWRSIFGFIVLCGIFTLVYDGIANICKVISRRAKISTKP